MCVDLAPVVRSSRTVRMGGPCTCAPGRYVRFVIPKVPGLASSVISCRESCRASVREHEIPADAHIEIYIGGLIAGPVGN